MRRCCTGGHHCPSSFPPFFHHPILPHQPAASSCLPPPALPPFLPPLPSQQSDHPSTLPPTPPSVVLFCPHVSIPGPGWLTEPDIKVKSLHPSYPSSLCLSFFLPPLTLHFLHPVAALEFLSACLAKFILFPHFLLLFLSSVCLGWKWPWLCSVILFWRYSFIGKIPVRLLSKGMNPSDPKDSFNQFSLMIRSFLLFLAKVCFVTSLWPLTNKICPFFPLTKHEEIPSGHSQYIIGLSIRLPEWRAPPAVTHKSEPGMCTHLYAASQMQ